MKMKSEKQLSQNEITSFCTHISIAIQAGITPLKSLNVLLNDSTTSASTHIYEQILKELKTEQPFHTASASTIYFPYYCLHLVLFSVDS